MRAFYSVQHTTHYLPFTCATLLPTFTYYKSSLLLPASLTVPATALRYLSWRVLTRLGGYMERSAGNGRALPANMPFTC